jgi:ketosteroid isomerase-like protein
MKNARSEIEAVLIRHAKAIRDKNAEALMACLTEDMTCFDLAPPLVQNPAATHDHTGYKAWFETWDGLIEIASSDLSVEAKDDVGWVSSLSHMTGRKTDGNDVDLWYRTMMIPTKVGHGFRFEVGHCSGMKSARIPR